MEDEKVKEFIREIEGLFKDTIIFNGRRVFPLADRNRIYPATVLFGKDYVVWRDKVLEELI